MCFTPAVVSAQVAHLTLPAAEPPAVRDSLYIPSTDQSEQSQKKESVGQLTEGHKRSRLLAGLGPGVSSLSLSSPHLLAPHFGAGVTPAPKAPHIKEYSLFSAVSGKTVGPDDVACSA